MFQIWLQAALVLAVHSMQLVLELMLRPEADWRAWVLTANAMCTDFAPLALCFIHQYHPGLLDGTSTAALVTDANTSAAALDTGPFPEAAPAGLPTSCSGQLSLGTQIGVLAVAAMSA